MKTKNKKTIKALLWFEEGEKNPEVYFLKPTKKEMETSKECGCKIIPCEIIYEDEK